MSAERRISFPEEPLRRVPQEPKPAIGNIDSKDGFVFAQEKDGQFYFWDNILSFPDSWTTPNKQIRILPEMSLPKVLIPLEAYEAPRPTVKKQEKYVQRSFNLDSPIPEDYQDINRDYWQNVDRGIFAKSKPLPLKRASNALHKRIMNSFPEIENPTKPLLSWSVLYDKPKEPTSEYVYAYRLPDSVKAEDKNDFFIGIERITEYATNYATREFLRKNMDFPGGKLLAELYGEVLDLLTYKILIGGIYRDMARIEMIADENGKNFKQAIIDALLKHDFNPINELIADTKEFSGWSDINDLAIHIGKRRWKKPDVSKWIGKLQVNEEDGSKKAHVKNAVLSLLAGGVYRNPGVTEISGGVKAWIILETVGVYFATLGTDIASFEHIKLLGLNTAVSLIPAIAIYIFVPTHESFHHYSSDKKYIGLIPAQIIRKKMTPKITTLEEIDN